MISECTFNFEHTFNVQTVSTTIFHTVKVPRMSTLRCSLTVWSTGCRPSSSLHRAESMPESFRSTHSCVLFASFHGVMMLKKWTLFCFQPLTTRRQGATMNFSSRTECGNSTVFQFNGTLCNMIRIGKPYKLKLYFSIFFFFIGN